LGFAKDLNVAVTGRGTVKVDEASLVTSVQGVFACGDAVTGPLMVVDAMASGRKAAASIDLYLKGEPLPTTAEPKAEVKKPSEEEIEELKEKYPEKTRLKMAEMPVDTRTKNFSEVSWDSRQSRLWKRPSGAWLAASAQNAASASDCARPAPSTTT